MEAAGTGAELATRTDLTTAAEVAEVDADRKAMKVLIAVDRVAEPYLNEIKRYVSSKAQKNGVAIGEAGVIAIHEAVIKIV